MSATVDNEEKYEAALARAYSLMQLNLLPESKESDELESIASAIEDFENTHYPIQSS